VRRLVVAWLLTLRSSDSNENFPLPLVEALRVLGHDVLTSLEAGNANAATPDEKVLVFAAAQKRVLMTVNRLHFLRLHRDMPENKKRALVRRVRKARLL